MLILLTFYVYFIKKVFIFLTFPRHSTYFAQVKANEGKDCS